MYHLDDSNDNLFAYHEIMDKIPRPSDAIWMIIQGLRNPRGMELDGYQKPGYVERNVDGEKIYICVGDVSTFALQELFKKTFTKETISSMRSMAKLLRISVDNLELIEEMFTLVSRSDFKEGLEYFYSFDMDMVHKVHDMSQNYIGVEELYPFEAWDTLETIQDKLKVWEKFHDELMWSEL